VIALFFRYLVFRYWGHGLRAFWAPAALNLVSARASVRNQDHAGAEFSRVRQISPDALKGIPSGNFEPDFGFLPLLQQGSYVADRNRAEFIAGGRVLFRLRRVVFLPGDQHIPIILAPDEARDIEVIAR